MRSRTKSLTPEGGEVQLVTFRLGRELYGVDVTQVREIGKVEVITKVPKMPEFIEGVMNLRGQITTVIDLRKRFDITENGGRTSKSRIIVAEIGGVQVGIIVDSVEDVIRVSKASISNPPDTLLSNTAGCFLTGICQLPDGLIMQIDLSNVFSETEMERIAGAGDRRDNGPEPVNKVTLGSREVNL